MKNNKTQKRGGFQVPKKNSKTKTRSHKIKAKTMLHKISQSKKSSVKTETKNSE